MSYMQQVLDTQNAALETYVDCKLRNRHEFGDTRNIRTRYAIYSAKYARPAHSVQSTQRSQQQENGGLACPLSFSKSKVTNDPAPLTFVRIRVSIGKRFTEGKQAKALRKPRT